jgi:hypothetical protein
MKRFTQFDDGGVLCFVRRVDDETILLRRRHTLLLVLLSSLSLCFFVSLRVRRKDERQMVEIKSRL